MSTGKSPNKKERLSFLINPELSNEITRISKLTHQTVSEFARKALVLYIDKIEQERVSQELEAGYKANYHYYMQSQEDWKYADKE